MSNEELTKAFLDKLEAVVVRTNDIADAVYKLIGKFEAKDQACINHGASVARAHIRVDEMEKILASIEKLLNGMIARETIRESNNKDTSARVLAGLSFLGAIISGTLSYFSGRGGH